MDDAKIRDSALVADDELAGEDVADLDVLGYHVCPKCGNWAADRQTCPVCLAARGAAAGLTVDVEIAGHLVSVGSRKRQQRRGGYRSSTRATNVSKARARAAARLKACYPDLFEMMVAEELARLGERSIRVRTDTVRHLNRIALDSVTSERRPA